MLSQDALAGVLIYEFGSQELLRCLIPYEIAWSRYSV